MKVPWPSAPGLSTGYLDLAASPGEALRPVLLGEKCGLAPAIDFAADGRLRKSAVSIDIAVAVNRRHSAEMRVEDLRPIREEALSDEIN